MKKYKQKFLKTARNYPEVKITFDNRPLFFGNKKIPRFLVIDKNHVIIEKITTFKHFVWAMHELGHAIDYQNGFNFHKEQQRKNGDWAVILREIRAWKAAKQLIPNWGSEHFKIFKESFSLYRRQYRYNKKNNIFLYV